LIERKREMVKERVAEVAREKVIGRESENEGVGAGTVSLVPDGGIRLETFF
jgi:hypothetical protein